MVCTVRKAFVTATPARPADDGLPLCSYMRACLSQPEQSMRIRRSLLALAALLAGVATAPNLLVPDLWAQERAQSERPARNERPAQHSEEGQPSGPSGPSGP